MHRIVLAGSVTSSYTTLKLLVKHKLDVVGVLGYEPDDPGPVSGYVNMKAYCDLNNIPYYPFKKISAVSTREILSQLSPDIFFVVGLSQLVPEEMLQIARLGNIGFHPTLLPQGRGRAPIAWLILEERSGAANFFLMGEGTDDGPVFVQQPFPVESSDNAAAIEQKIIGAIELALDEWLPKLKEGLWEPVPQDESLATWYGKRTPDDGWINWTDTADQIDKVIRAASSPHPGAYTFLNQQKLIVLKCRPEHEKQIKGVPGSVLLKSAQKEYLVQTGCGLLWISDVYDENNQETALKVGQKLGFYAELEIYKLKKEIESIKKKLA